MASGTLHTQLCVCVCVCVYVCVQMSVCLGSKPSCLINSHTVLLAWDVKTQVCVCSDVNTDHDWWVCGVIKCLLWLLHSNEFYFIVLSCYINQLHYTRRVFPCVHNTALCSAPLNTYNGGSLDLLSHFPMLPSVKYVTAASFNNAGSIHKTYILVHLFTNMADAPRRDIHRFSHLHAIFLPYTWLSFLINNN